MGPTGPTGKGAPEGPTGPDGMPVYGTASILFTTLPATTFTTMTGTTGVSTSRPIWFSGIQPGAVITSNPQWPYIADVGLSSNYGANWSAFITVYSQLLLSNAEYTLYYYTE